MNDITPDEENRIYRITSLDDSENEFFGLFKEKLGSKSFLDAMHLYFQHHSRILSFWFIDILFKVKLPYDPSCPSVGWSVCLSVIISAKGGK